MFMKPKNLKTKIFLDSGDPGETRDIIEKLGFLDGQTTNPTLISKNPEAIKRIASGKKFTKGEIYTFYKEVIRQISSIIPNGSISIEVYSDFETKYTEMIEQAKEMNSWVPNAHIKLPITKEGLTAANKAIKDGIKVNMTLCFNQEQAIAVHRATLGAKRGSVFVSPFIGRLDDIGKNGVQLIDNILKSYRKEKEKHTEVLAASVRSLDHLLSVLSLNCDIVTAPYNILLEWVNKGLPVPESRLVKNNGLKSIPYMAKSFSKDWKKFNLNDELTKKGIERFCSDWNALIG